jgi:tripeptidyl-peptidase-1
LTVEKINNIVAAPVEERQMLKNWLASYGVVSVEDRGDALKFEATAQQAENLFNTNLYVFVNKRNGQSVVRQAGEISIPEQFTSVIVTVSGVADFPVPKKEKEPKKNPDTVVVDPPQDEDTLKVVPYVIDNLYGIPFTYTTYPNSSIGLIEFQNNEGFKASDLSYFQTQNNLPQVPVSKIIGPYHNQSANAESSLDVQYGSSIAINASVWFWTNTGWLLEFVNDFVNYPQVPYVISMSWGWTENQQCSITSCLGLSNEEYVAQVNAEFQKIGLRGVTIFAASGDQGAPGDANPHCVNKAEPISPLFPAASPFLTAVGATMLQQETLVAAPPICNTYTCANVTLGSPEVTCSYPTALITSGGGFSFYSSMPSWQSTAVNAYIKAQTATLPPQQYWNASNRAVPDVSALGHDYLIRNNGVWMDVDGTSCSTPVWAGMATLLNDWLLSNNKAPLGFLNPLLYQLGAQSGYFFDVTVGNNKCTESSCCQYGYSAAPGWDATSGLGTPNFQNILNYVKNNL